MLAAGRRLSQARRARATLPSQRGAPLTSASQRPAALDSLGRAQPGSAIAVRPCRPSTCAQRLTRLLGRHFPQSSTGGPRAIKPAGSRRAAARCAARRARTRPALSSPAGGGVPGRAKQGTFAGDATATTTAQHSPKPEKRTAQKTARRRGRVVPAGHHLGWPFRCFFPFAGVAGETSATGARPAVLTMIFASRFPLGG